MEYTYRGQSIDGLGRGGGGEGGEGEIVVVVLSKQSARYYEMKCPVVCASNG